MSLTPVLSSYEDIGGVPSMQSCYSAGMKRCGICMEERSPLWVRRSKSEETLCRLLITMVEETFDIRWSWVDHGRPVMNLKSRYVEGENSKWKVKQRKNLGVALDNRLTFDHHVSAISKSCFFHIRAFRHIRPALTQEMANSVAVSLVTSRLDYANSLLFGTSQANLNKLQRIQNHLGQASRSQPHLLIRRTPYLALAPCQATHQLQNRHTHL